MRKTLVKFSSAVLASLLALPACAQQARPNDADPALWVVKDADTTVYLFGTVHVLKPGLTWFDEAVKTAFDRSGELVLEMVAPPPAQMQQLALAKGFSPAGPTLTEQLPAEKRAGVAKALSEVGLPQQAYDRMKPWLAAVTVSVAPLSKLGYSADLGPEKVLTDAATKGGKKVGGLETAEQQLGFFDQLSATAQVKFLTASVDELPELPREMDKMVADWSRGDPDALAAVMNDSLKESPEVAKVLLTDRNRNWAGWIRNRMAQPGTVFVAVGAGHLAGPDAVQAQLAKLGVKAARVKY